MMQTRNTDRLKKIFNNVITGQVSLNARKQVASGKTITVTMGEDTYKIVVTDGHAFMYLGDASILDAASELYLSRFPERTTTRE
jgi:hypothetical protein